MTRTKDELFADWCASRGVSAEAERAAREAYEAAVKAEAPNDASEAQQPPAVPARKTKRNK
ncbi:hypothetical protein D3C87_1283160 [compost metagenome]